MKQKITKNNRFIYNLTSILRYFYPRFLLDKDKILRDVEKRADFSDILERVNYYNKLTSLNNINNDIYIYHAQRALESNQDSAIKCATFATRTPKKPPIKTTNFPMPRKQTVYYFDTYEFARYFDNTLILEAGDVNYYLNTPSICKSRPIAGNNANNVLLNLNKVRHFNFINDPYSFNDKDNVVYFRGGVYQQHRKIFFEKYFNHSRCDLGHTGKATNDLIKWIKPKASIKEHLKHKFIISLEGNDVATNLKWIMSSNSIAVSPKLKFETWFMEGRLKGDYHYIEIDDDYENLFDKIDFYINNPYKAQTIINNANAYCKQFVDKHKEAIISLLVLEKYFAATNF